jgi:cell division protein FtsB
MAAVEHFLVKWAPTILVAIMIPFVAWLWHARETTIQREANLQTQLSVQAGKLEALTESRIQRDGELKQLSDRIDVQRVRIDGLQQQIYERTVSGERRSR